MQPLPQRSLVDRLAIELAMVFGIGRLPKAPGTFGSLPGLGVAWCCHRLGDDLAANFPAVPWLSWATILLGNALLILLSYWAIARTERCLGIHDDQRIVIDEVAGQALALVAAPLSWPYYAAGFVLFRLFDIAKPGPIGYLDRSVPGAFGTLGDDLLAGVAGGLVLAAVLYLAPAGMLP